MTNSIDRGYAWDGKVRAIGITSQGRSALALDIPAVSESVSLKGYSLENWFGLFAPKGTPAPVIAKLNAAVVDALKDPAVSTRLKDLGGNPTRMSPDQFAGFIKHESAKFARIVEEAQITPEN